MKQDVVLIVSSNKAVISPSLLPQQGTYSPRRGTVGGGRAGRPFQAMQKAGIHHSPLEIPLSRRYQGLTTDAEQDRDHAWISVITMLNYFVFPSELN